MYSQKSRCPQNAAAALFSFSVQPGVSSGLAGGDEAHLVDLVGVAATGQVVDGSVQALQDGAVGSVAAQTLCDLIADVAGLDAGEDEGVGLTGDLAALALDLCDLGSNGCVELDRKSTRLNSSH